MEIKELKTKNPSELQALLAQSREKLRELRFKDSNRQLKNIREIRQIRETIARILTVLNTKA
ncbi:MAG TPA: 50S ribosomal protein L29 [bacterium]|jgi:ribosomal protein L29|nr:MAG: 50S ribosomal protein L29 [Parcubacteria group bacterium ADurb.Bin115]HNU81130.1 50S ribosomal protein L29 [bacterium]HOD86720.1 50S ribosomal protein L29 [bacterium]HPW05720.1 50S ribosomal protein L29 [bacterium]HPY99541.1 50S ribosomal protein L29 [bacterium]